MRRPACRARVEPTALRPWFEKDGVFYTLDHTTTTQVMNVVGQEIMQKHDQTFAIRWCACGLDDDGNVILDAKILAIKMRLDIGGNVIEFDTTDNRFRLSSNLGLIKHLINVDLRFFVRDGRLAKVEGVKGILKEYESQNPQALGRVDVALAS